MGVTNYKHKHQVIDSDAHFTIDAITRNITNDNSEKNVLIQGDHNSERFTFAIPRYIDGHDMMLCNHVQVAYINTQTSGRSKQYSTGVYLVNDLELHPTKKDYVQCRWLISHNATRYEGALNFMLILSCMEGEMVTYRWKTNVFESIHVAVSLDSNLVFEDEYVDIIEQWKNSVTEYFTEYVNIGMDAKAENVKAELHETLTNELTEYLQTHIDGFNETLTTEVDHMNNAIDTFDDILETEITKMDDSIDVLKARMDTFTALDEGSTTGDAELADIRIGADGKTYASAGDAVRGQIGQLLDIPTKVDLMEHKTDLFTTNNLFNNGMLHMNKLYNSEYHGVESSQYSYFEVYLTPGEYNVTPKARFVYSAVDGTQFGTAESSVGISFSIETEGLYYITMYTREMDRWKLFDAAYNEANVMSYGSFTLGDKFVDPRADVLAHLTNYKVSKTNGRNILDLTTLTPGFLNSVDGYVAESAVYYTTPFIPVKAGEPISFSNVARKFLAYNLSKVALQDTFMIDGGTNFTFIPTEDGYVRYSIQDKYFDAAMISYTESYIPYDEYEPFYYVTEENVRLSNSQIEEVKKVVPEIVPEIAIPLVGYQNVLYGKKWVACGDSFTWGGSEGTTNFEDGLYAGKNKVYPYFIGNRNHMDIVNLAVGGQTMCNIDGTRSNAFSNERYKNIPADADYITLKFGINDVNYKSPVGTIDDTETTTFYGAYNTVMEYILTNHPYAKVGIIVTNGCNSNSKYTEATRKIARKWGIPVLDEAADYNVPLLHRVGEKTDICQKAIDIRLAAFRVSETDTHPNDKAHEYESTIVENWLRSL